MLIQIPTLIMSVSCPAKVSEDEFPDGDPADRFDTSTDNGIENFQVRASSIEQLTSRSFRAINVEIETNKEDRERRSMTDEAAQMLVLDYIEPTDQDDDAVCMLTAFE